MAGIESQATYYAFNRGIISPLALTRIDLKRYALSASTMLNWMPRELGSMMLRPGTAYVDVVTSGNNPAVHIPFIYSIVDTAIVEMTFEAMRVRVNEAHITRASVATAITNGNFNGNLNNWTQSDSPGCTSAWATGNYMSLIGTLFNFAARYQQVTVASGDRGKEHGLHIIIAKGYVNLAVGTSAGDGTYVFLKNLGPGEYSFSFTPTNNFYVEFSSSTQYASLVQSVAIEAAGSMTIATPFQSTDLNNIRWDQSADVLFLAINGYQQYKIERFVNTNSANDSWALVKYYADDGPFQIENTDNSVQLTPSAVNGDITISASNSFFTSNMVGVLLRIESQGQFVTVTLGAQNEFSDPIEVTGIGSQRQLNFTITGTFVATITIQQSVGAPGAWVDYLSYTSTQNTSFNDGDDNQIIYYRIGIKTGNYTSGSAVATMTFNGGSIKGIARIDAVNSATSVNAHVLKAFGGTGASTNWWEGVWGDGNGFPTVPVLYEGRLWWLGNDYIIASVSDAYGSFDDTVIGDSAPIIRTLAQGPVSIINWALGLNRLLVGCDGNEQSVRSDSLDAPLTATNFNVKSPSTRGSSAAAALKIDVNGIFIQRGDPANDNTLGTRLIQMAYQGTWAIIDYTSTDLSEFCPEILAQGIVKIAVQRKIDTRIHCLMADGTVVICVYDPIEDMKSFIQVQLPGGTVEDIFVMPGGVEDKVYYSVVRVINGTTYRYLERWAMESECTGLPMAKNVDSHIVYSGAAVTTITGLSSLEGQTVNVWGWNTSAPFTVTMPDGSTQTVGRDMGTYTVTSGTITGLPAAVTNAVVGIGYTAPWQSVKLAQTIQGGTTLGQVKNIDHLGVILANAHSQGLQYGPNFNDMQPMPLNEGGYNIDPNTVWSAYDNEPFEFDGDWDTDSRLCLLAASPRPVTITAAVIEMKTNVKQ